MKIQEQVLTYIAERAKKLADEIDLIICYGSYVTGNATEFSDVDVFYIPRSANRELSETFILKDVGYDIFPLSWDTLQDIADFKNGLSPLLGDSQILFFYSKEEIKHFNELKQQMKRNLTDKLLMQQHAVGRLQRALLLNQQIQQTADWSFARELAGKLLSTLSTCIAYQNQTYFHKGIKEHYQALQKMSDLPKNFFSLYQKILQTQNLTDLQIVCQEIVADVGTFCNYPVDHPVVPAADTSSEAIPDYQQAATWYDEVCSSFNKLHTCQQTNNNELAFLTASSLQQSLKEDLSIELASTDLMSAFCFNDLSHLVERARAIQKDCIERILSGGGILHRYETVVELYQRHGLK